MSNIAFILKWITHSEALSNEAGTTFIRRYCFAKLHVSRYEIWSPRRKRCVAFLIYRQIDCFHSQRHRNKPAECVILFCQQRGFELRRTIVEYQNYYTSCLMSWNCRRPMPKIDIADNIALTIDGITNLIAAHITFVDMVNHSRFLCECCRSSWLIGSTIHAANFGDILLMATSL